MINNRKQQLLLFVIALFFVNCARQIAPIGGDKDIYPPEVVIADPANYSTHFNRHKFQITFDEYILLKSVNQELLISPPIIKKPEILLQGKSLIVKFDEKLPDSTTINFNFHKGIADYNEGNIKEDFQYVVSTGNEIDTVFTIGNIRDAFSQAPIDGAFVMLYTNHEDSVPKTILPSFICKTNQNGMFRFNNIPAGSFKLFALIDANYNKLFDLPTEKIAFQDDLVKPEVELLITYDTIRLDTIYGIDTTYNDTIIRHAEVVSKIDTIQLFMFEEKHNIQYMVESKRDEEGKKISFVFNEGLHEPLLVKPLNFYPDKDWYIMLESPNRDSIDFWISDTSLVKKDTILLNVNYHIYDSLGEFLLKSDTLKILLDEKDDKKQRGNIFKRKNDEDTIKISELSLKTNIDRRILELKSPLIIKTRFPIATYKTNNIYLYILEDTLEIPVQFQIEENKDDMMNFEIKFPFEESASYKLLADTAAFKDIFGNINDTLIATFTVRESDFYGNIELSIIGLHDNAILQVMSEKEAVLREYPINTDKTKIEIELVKPAKYMLKLFIDNNGNGTWDTGKYDEKRQAEKVYYYDQIINIKSGWDNEIVWDIHKTPLRNISAPAKGKKK